MQIKHLIVGFGALAVLPAMSLPAPAQGFITDPAAVQSCLCAEAALPVLRERLQQRLNAYDSERQALQTLDGRVQSGRAQLQAGSGDIDAFKQLLDQRDRTQIHFANETTPAYNAEVARYNAAADTYNQCHGRMAPEVAAQERAAGLACPRP